MRTSTLRLTLYSYLYAKNEQKRRDFSSRPLFSYYVTGVPAPSVVWLREGDVIDTTYAALANGTVRNELLLPHVDRSYLHDTLTCVAKNSNLTRPVERRVHVDMNFPPSTVRIDPVGEGGRLVAGRPQQVRCRTRGSRPPAQVTWHLDGRRIEGGGGAGGVIETVRGVLGQRLFVRHTDTICDMLAYILHDIFAIPTQMMDKELFYTKGKGLQYFFFLDLIGSTVNSLVL